MKVARRWRDVYRAIDQYGQIIDVLVAARRDTQSARRFFFATALRVHGEPIEVVTDRAWTLRRGRCCVSRERFGAEPFKAVAQACSDAVQS